jgi:hypothetical protein
MSDRHPILSGAEAWSAAGSGSRASVAIVVSHGFTGNHVATLDHDFDLLVERITTLAERLAT